MRIDPRRTFRLVIASSSNREAIEQARWVARRARTAANPLLLYGRSGVGKTMLLAATANALARRDCPNLVAFTAEEFRNDYVRAIRTGTVAAFRAGIDRGDALVVDELEDFDGYPSALQELQRAIGLAVERGRPVVLASAPTSSGEIELMVRSFPLGVITPLLEPTIGQRLTALQQLASRRRRRVPQTTLRSIARGTPTIAEARAKLEVVLLTSA